MKLHRLWQSSLPMPDQPQLLATTEANHARHVLRLTAGSDVEVIDGSGKSVRARLRFAGKKVWVDFIAHHRQALQLNQQPYPVTLFLAICKSQALEWIIEKAVELGVTQVMPFYADHSAVTTKATRLPELQQRWQKIADQSLKQCERLQSLRIVPQRNLNEAMHAAVLQAAALHAAVLQASANMQMVFWGDEQAQGEAPYLMTSLQSLPPTASMPQLGLCIGPEGGWSAAERHLMQQSHWQAVSLGPNILRVETAALFAISQVVAFFQSRANQPAPVGTR